MRWMTDEPAAHEPRRQKLFLPSTGPACRNVPDKSSTSSSSTRGKKRARDGCRAGLHRAATKGTMAGVTTSVHREHWDWDGDETRAPIQVAATTFSNILTTVQLPKQSRSFSADRQPVTGFSTSSESVGVSGTMCLGF
ncbi:hypothetical protein MPTK1_6g06610 [Marchantia polymorpha subsp. ruderalis]|uniref:Uncharacterized protein n=2 Tax=Marchantia polymorpha TaxID=3197 RepID=A0AAF6BP80_MARPO|nr:hypothetical protein MARPO_0173s0006 [Marchantia polymorpha]BBN13814.1 hypothetical protein Mp_6g06610 [Marchantia polymorpha subsp. ruderalis]|eukprot:PTQ28103.1 hypothetical protein MARPO_0173s0006 [Marchantia polymorpha]